MKKAALRWLLPFLRYGLCAVAIVYLVRCVDWHDHVRLSAPDAHGKPVFVRLVAQEGDEQFVVIRDSREETLPAEQIFFAEIGARRLPEIRLGIASVVRDANKLGALWAILLFLPVSLVQCSRLVVMLAIQGVRISFWTSTKLTFVGNFFNFALPGTTGGDLIKAYYLTRYTHLKTETVTTVFLDRAIGLLGLVLIAGVSILLTHDRQKFGQVMASLAVLCAVLAAGSIVVFSRRMRELFHLRQIAEHLPMGEQLLRVGRATVAMRQHKPLVLLSLFMTLVLQANVMICAVVMARALGMHGDASYYFIYVSIGFLIAAIPIAPPQAFGVMEAFYVQFFTQGGLANDPAQAVALALAMRLIQLVWALPGVLVPILGAHLPGKAELAHLGAEAQASLGAADSTAQPAASTAATPE